eukprot:CAMPEP_0197624292 /NCGR_PEP_ID=MMETSP1338-20131121/3990_1 /TAXON_ID=43686 ORGANISM="Pelagodinium beii, Strain RCC1491" /NCGR_SAMPLE_ID=MMETSP1338 /ASSEMBLY_ACC=CAM_ASM_000754 /LENGTH=82 /DNA_ID=CAMNT_0043194409 /DNA_START=120 /DNA_END=369 /DNA_ORIENTATION=+
MCFAIKIEKTHELRSSEELRLVEVDPEEHGWAQADDEDGPAELQESKPAAPAQAAWGAAARAAPRMAGSAASKRSGASARGV